MAPQWRGDPDPWQARNFHGGDIPKKQQGTFMIWVNYNDLTAASLEIMVSKGNHPLLWPEN